MSFAAEKAPPWHRHRKAQHAHRPYGVEESIRVVEKRRKRRSPYELHLEPTPSQRKLCVSMCARTDIRPPFEPLRPNKLAPSLQHDIVWFRPHLNRKGEGKNDPRRESQGDNSERRFRCTDVHTWPVALGRCHFASCLSTHLVDTLPRRCVILNPLCS